MEEKFGDRIQDYPTPSEAKELTANLVKKHSELGLHDPDSILLAIAIHEFWGNVISNDDSLKQSCKAENISCFDQTKITYHREEARGIHIDEFLSELKDHHKSKEMDDDIILVFKILANEWNEIKKLGYVYGDTERIKKFERGFHMTITGMKNHDSIFERLHEKKYHEIIVEKFFSQILISNTLSYEKLTDMLRSKEEITDRNADSLENLVRS